MANTPTADAPEWAAAQETPWLTHNKALRMLEGYAKRIIKDRDLTAPPGSCSDGDTYLVDTVATGLWATHDGELAIAVGANAANGWYFIDIATEGMTLYVQDENISITYNGSAWQSGGIGVFHPLQIAVSDETTALTAGTGKMSFRLAGHYLLADIRASVSDAVDSGAPVIVDVNVDGVSILSTKLHIDAFSRTSVGSATAVVISDNDLPDEGEVTIDIDDPGEGASGLKVTFIGYYI